MTIADLRRLLNRSPFRPFQIHLTSGEVLPVRHPETMSLPNAKDVDLFSLWVGRNWNLIEAAQVARISLL